MSSPEVYVGFTQFRNTSVALSQDLRVCGPLMLTYQCFLHCLVLTSFGPIFISPSETSNSTPWGKGLCLLSSFTTVCLVNLRLRRHSYVDVTLDISILQLLN